MFLGCPNCGYFDYIIHLYQIGMFYCFRCQFQWKP